MNDQQIRSILAKRAVQEKRQRQEIAKGKITAKNHRAAVAAMHRVAKGN